MAAEQEISAKMDLSSTQAVGGLINASARPDSRGEIKVLDDYPKSTLDLVKYAIFIIDCAQAHVLVKSKPKNLEELKFRCVEAMGLRAANESVRMELIFAGFEGPLRSGLYTDGQLDTFLSTLPQDYSGQSKGDAAVQAALALQRAEYEKILRGLRREIDDQKAEISRLTDRNTELEEEAERMNEQFRVRLEQAEVDIEKKCRKEFKKELARVEAEWKAKVEDLRNKLGELNQKYLEKVQECEQLQTKLEAAELELEETKEEMAAMKRRLEARIAELEPFVEKCASLQKEADLWRKRYEQLLKEMDKEDAPPDDVDSNSFEWAIPGMSSKLRFPKGRAVQSPEFTIKGMSEPAQLEFFPKGDSSTWDGWCAVKLRVPDETQVMWSAWVGTCRQGPRGDQYDQNSWWCRQGLVWSNFCLVHEMQTQIDDSDNLICGVEVHAVGPFNRDDPSHPPCDPAHPLPLEARPFSPAFLSSPERALPPASPPDRSGSSQRSARTGAAANQWQQYGFLEIEEDSPKTLLGGSAWGTSRSPKKGRSSRLPAAGRGVTTPSVGWADPSSPTRGLARGSPGSRSSPGFDKSSTSLPFPGPSSPLGKMAARANRWAYK